MAFFRGDVYSYALDKMTPLCVYLPQDDNARFCVKRPQKTLILLHGLEGNNTYWSRFTSVERYAQSRNIALIMPEGEMSMYADMKCGLSYATYIGEELPKLIGTLFHTPIDRENLSICGLSMGGYGALRMALAHPETFGRVASFSGAFMIGTAENLEENKRYRDPGRTGAYVEMEEIERSLHNASLGAYGSELVYSPENDIFKIAKEAVASGAELPKALLTCGYEDFLYDVNVNTHNTLTEIGVPNELKEWHGVHNWQFWEESIRDYIDFFVD